VNAAIIDQGFDFFPRCPEEGLRTNESCPVVCKADKLIKSTGTAKCVEQGKVEVESPECSRAPLFTCKSGEQILELLKCDGGDDCEDGSDEEGCHAQRLLLENP